MVSTTKICYGKHHFNSQQQALLVCYLTRNSWNHWWLTLCGIYNAHLRYTILVLHGHRPCKLSRVSALQSSSSCSSETLFPGIPLSLAMTSTTKTRYDEHLQDSRTTLDLNFLTYTPSSMTSMLQILPALACLSAQCLPQISWSFNLQSLSYESLTRCKTLVSLSHKEYMIKVTGTETPRYAGLPD